MGRTRWRKADLKNLLFAWMIWWNSSFWICPKFTGHYYVFSEYYLQSCIERYLMPVELSLCYKKKSSLFLSPIWLTLLSYICSYLEAIFQIPISNPSNNYFQNFLSNSDENATGWQKQTHFQVMFVFLFLLIPWWCHCFPLTCWSPCSHPWGWVCWTVKEVNHF